MATNQTNDNKTGTVAVPVVSTREYHDRLRKLYATSWEEMFPELPRDANGNLIEDGNGAPSNQAVE